MNLRELVNATEEYVRGEIEAQRRLSEALDNQTEAVKKSHTDGLVDSCAQVEAELGSTPKRERERRRLLAGFGQLWGLDPTILSLGSIAERLGSHGATLGELRLELREQVGEVMRKTRRLSALARYQQGIFEDVLRTVAGDGAQEDGRGVLLNAEA